MLRHYFANTGVVSGNKQRYPSLPTGSITIDRYLKTCNKPVAINHRYQNSCNKISSRPLQ